MGIAGEHSVEEKTYYGDERPIWSCQSTAIASIGNWTHADRVIWLSLPKPYSSHLSFMKWSEEERVLEDWVRAVEMYSKRQLTVSEDKFPTLSAIPAQIQEVTGWTYVAGLLRERMLPGRRHRWISQ